MFSIARRALLKASAAGSSDFASPLTDTDVTDAGASATIDDPPSALVSDVGRPPTPGLRIDELFNVIAAGPSDRPGDVAALRADMMGQFLVRQAYAPLPPEDNAGFLLQTVELADGLLLMGAVFVSAKRRHGFAPPGTPDRRHDPRKF